jgi:hypothetical protein
MRIIMKKYLIFLVFLLASCITPPDGKSGGDGDRHEAKQLQMNQWVPDSIAYSDGDRTDWRYMEVEDSGLLVVELQFDNENANVNVEIFDKYGKRLTRHVKRAKEDVNLQFTQEVQGGKYFVKVQAESEGDKTGYSLRVRIK